MTPYLRSVRRLVLLLGVLVGAMAVVNIAWGLMFSTAWWAKAMSLTSGVAGLACAVVIFLMGRKLAALENDQTGEDRS